MDSPPPASKYSTGPQEVCAIVTLQPGASQGRRGESPSRIGGSWRECAENHRGLLIIIRASLVVEQREMSVEAIVGEKRHCARVGVNDRQSSTIRGLGP